MKEASVYRVKEWYNVLNNERINCSPFSLPNGYNPDIHKTRKTNRYGYHLHDDNTYHSLNRPLEEQTQENVVAFLERKGYNIVNYEKVNSFRKRG